MFKYKALFLLIITTLLFSCLEPSEPKDDIVSAVKRGDRAAVSAFLENALTADTTDDILRTPLMFAAAGPSLELAELLINSGADPLFKDRAGRNALTHAVIGGNLELVELLVKGGGDLQQLDKSKKTLLMHAAEHNRTELISYLLKKGIKLEDKSFTGNRALMYAAENNNLDSVKLLLQRGARINAKNNYGSTALTFAVDFGHYESARYLLEQGASINVMSNYETTLLTSAVHYSDIKMVELLLDYGADVDAEDKNQYTGQQYASDKENSNLRKLLLSRGAHTNTWIGVWPTDTPDFYYTAIMNYESYEVVKKCIEKNYGDINYREKHSGDQTALMLAIYRGYPDLFYIMQLLIKSGADLNIEDRGGETVLMKAVEEEDLLSLALLTSMGVDVNYKSTKGFTAFDYIRDFEPDPAVKKLLKTASSKRVTLDEAVKILEIELTLAAYNNDLPLLKKRVEMGDYIDSRVGGPTPLMVASNNGNMEMVKYLLSKGADSTKTTYEQYDAADIALIANHYEIAALLLKSKESPFVVGGHTPITYYASQYNIEGIEYFLKEGYDINKIAEPIESKKKESALMKSIVDRRFLPTAKFLIDSSADVNAIKKGGITPLMKAASNHPAEFISLLLDAGAEIDAVDNRGMTALAHAALSGSYENALLLIERGADINIIADKRESLIHIGYKYPAIVKLLLDKGHKVEPSMDSSLLTLKLPHSTFLNSLKVFVDDISFLEAINPYKMPDYELEFHDRPLPTFKTLLAYGADPYTGFTYSDNALRKAYDQRNRVAMRMMLELGYSLEKHINQEFEPVMDSLKELNFTISQLLIESGADVNRYDIDGYTPLYYAIYKDNLKTVEVLIKGGADVNKPKKHGVAPIFRAIRNRNLSTVRLLVENGADLHIVDTNGHTPLEAAERRNLNSIVEYLNLHLQE